MENDKFDTAQLLQYVVAARPQKLVGDSFDFLQGFFLREICGFLDPLNIKGSRILRKNSEHFS